MTHRVMRGRAGRSGETRVGSNLRCPIQWRRFRGVHKQKTWRPTALVSGLAVLFVSVGIVFAGDSGRQAEPQGSQQVELAFRAAVNAWAYNEFWRLYRMGTKDSRAVLSEPDFAVQMEDGWRKPGIGLEILDVHIRGVHAVIRAKVRMEYGRYTREPLRNRPLSAVPTDEVIQSVLLYEEGEWRINLAQFVGMARY